MLTVRQARALKGFTQKQVAEACGISYPALSNIETGKTFPRMSTMQKLQRILGNNIDWGRTWATNAEDY